MQSATEVAPTTKLVVSAAQIEHEEEPFVSPYLPATHSAHVEFEVAAITSDCAPTGHLSHTEAPASEYVPLSQSAHVLLMAKYFPALQSHSPEKVDKNTRIISYWPKSLSADFLRIFRPERNYRTGNRSKRNLAAVGRWRRPNKQKQEQPATETFLIFMIRNPLSPPSLTRANAPSVGYGNDCRKRGS